jgi:alkylation response protein AidB-like acyl-CoA dehydrogenase
MTPEMHTFEKPSHPMRPDSDCPLSGQATRDDWCDLASRGLFSVFDNWDAQLSSERLDHALSVLITLGAQRRLGLAFSAGAHLFAVMSILRKFGSHEQRGRWLSRLADGSMIGAIAMAEPQGSSDAFALRTQARRSAEGYTLNGIKTHITNGTVCDLVLLFARDLEANKVICAVLEKNTLGLDLGAPIPTMGLNDSNLGEIRLNDCMIADDQVIATGQRAKWAFMHAMEWERGLILAPLVGLMRRQIGECIRWTNSRTQGKGTLLDLQAVRHRLADMQKRYHIVKSVTKDFADLKKAGKNAFGEASLVKIIVSDAFLDNSMDAMKLYGAHGYTMDSTAQQDLRDAMAFQMASGSTDIQKNIAVEWLSRKFI